MVATNNLATALGSAPTVLPTLSPTPAPTDVPWEWIPINDGRQFPRDTVSAIAIDPRNPDGLYIGTENSGLYKTTDGGQTWKPLYNGVTGASVESLVMDPNNPDILYAGLNGEVLQTTDGGESWQRVPLDWCGWPVVLAAPRGHGKIYSAGVCLFVRKGSDWVRVKAADTCPNEISSLAVHPSDENALLASQHSASGSCAAGVYLATDGGQEWKLLHSWEKGEPVAVIWNVDPQGMEEIYVNVSGALWVSLDRGVTWIMVRKLFTGGFVPMADGYVILYYGNNLYKVTNHGNSWESLSLAPLHSFRTVVVSPDDPNRIYLGGEYLLASNDGGRRWKKAAGGIGAAALDLRLAPGDDSLMYMAKASLDKTKFGENDSIQLFRSRDSGHTWELISSRGLGLALDADDKTLYRFWNGDDWRQTKLLRSPDQGETWQELPSLSMINIGIKDIVAHPFIPGKLFVEYVFDSTIPGFLVSTDRGIFWRNVDWTVVNASQADPSHPPYELSFLPSPSRSPLAFLYRVYGSEFFRSVDEGSTWSPCGHVDYVNSETRLIIDPRDSNRMYIAARDGVYLSTDGCQSWQERTTGIGYQRVNTLALDPVDPDILYAGTGIGAYVSRDAGQTWALMNDGLIGTPAVYTIVVDPQSNVYATTPYGVFRLERR